MTRSYLRACFLSTALFVAPMTASAQDVPPKMVQELLIRTTILTLNDANVTGNYDVLHARISKATQKKVTADQLKAGFKTFADNKLEMWTVAVSTPAITKSVVNADGLLELAGTFPMQNGNLTYDIKYIFENGDWEISDLNIGTEPT